jgi:hypothetical protein
MQPKLITRSPNRRIAATAQSPRIRQGYSCLLSAASLYASCVPICGHARHTLRLLSIGEKHRNTLYTLTDAQRHKQRGKLLACSHQPHPARMQDHPCRKRNGTKRALNNNEKRMCVAEERQAESKVTVTVWVTHRSVLTAHAGTGVAKSPLIPHAVLPQPS